MKLSHRLTTILSAAILASALFMTPSKAHARVFVSVGIAPPAIPVYAQPIAPGEGYIWTPGYWAWTDEGYQWVDGAWVLPPYEGALWTPGYWGYDPAGYSWNAGYWGPTVGYYGGINYGFGYFGTGFYGGYWGGGRFWYNRPYNNIGWGHGFHNVYNTPVHGFDGHPGGSSWTNHAYNGDRGSFMAGNANHGSANFAQHGSGFTQSPNNRPAYNGGSNMQRDFAGPSQGHNYAQPHGGYNGYTGNSFHGNTMNAGNYHPSMPSGSSFHGNAGGGSFHGGGDGGFHGGGGGGGFHGGGGGGHGHR
jgi:WXXGXW repeat (2 copies)